MGTEINCESTETKMKARIKTRNRLSRKQLKKEIIIKANGPLLFEMDEFISQCVDDFCIVFGTVCIGLFMNVNKTIQLTFYLDLLE